MIAVRAAAAPAMNVPWRLAIAPGAEFNGINDVVGRDESFGFSRDGRDHFARRGAPDAHGHETDDAPDTCDQSRHVEDPESCTMGCHESTVGGR